MAVPVARNRVGLIVMLSATAIAGCAVDVPVSGFRPIDPPHNYAFMKRSELATVNSLRPTLRWQPFPGEHQQYPGAEVKPFIALPADSIRDLTYELRLWAIGANGPDLAYEANGLTQPSHTITQDLKPRAVYFWSVRARFTFDGQSRVSDWSLTQMPCPATIYGPDCARGMAQRTGQIPAPNYYRFKTPDG